jgi:nitrogenase molybdenum-cofactor synthesis protein NifE
MDILERLNLENATLLEERRKQIFVKLKQDGQFDISCNRQSAAGSVSQRACVFCGSRVVLYPIADALHLVHGPVGCAAFTWDIRGSLSSGASLYRKSFNTDLREIDVIRGGEIKLYDSLVELIDKYKPKAAFVYSTCIVGLIGDDVNAVCRKVEREKGIPVIPVKSVGFSGTKKDGYHAACDSLFSLIKAAPRPAPVQNSINIIGDFNLAGEVWILKRYFERMGVRVIATMTGDGRIDEIRQSPAAALNIVQCSGSMGYLAKLMQGEYGIPFIKVSFFGIDDTVSALRDTAGFFKDPDIIENTEELIAEETARVMPVIKSYAADLAGKRAAVYTGGAFKAFSLIRSLELLGMKAVVAGSQTGDKDDYRQMSDMCENGSIIVDDANTLELAKFILEKDADIFIGGVKERPIAHKLGVGFCDHNHERKIALSGFEGMVNFAKEVHSSVMSPVWQFVPRRKKNH